MEGKTRDQGDGEREGQKKKGKMNEEGIKNEQMMTNLKLGFILKWESLLGVTQNREESYGAIAEISHLGWEYTH